MIILDNETHLKDGKAYFRGEDVETFSRDELIMAMKIASVEYLKLLKKEHDSWARGSWLSVFGEEPPK